MRNIKIALAATFGLPFVIGVPAKILADTQHYAVAVTCFGNSAVCDYTYDLFARSSGRLQAKFTISNGHCAPVQIDFMVNGHSIRSPQFGFSQTTMGSIQYRASLNRIVDMGPVKINDKN